MAFITVDQGESLILKYITNKLTATENLVLRLFTNNYTPVETTTESNVTEASGNGYSAITLTGASWTTSGTSQIAYAQQTFTFTGALGNVYGYYLTQTSSGLLVFVEKFSDGPYNIQNNGDTIKITPVILCD